MTRREVIVLRRAWGRLPAVAGIGMRRIPPVPSPRPSADEAMERLVLPTDPWDTGQLAAIYPDAGEGWRAER